MVIILTVGAWVFGNTNDVNFDGGSLGVTHFNDASFDGGLGISMMSILMQQSTLLSPY